MSSNKREFGEHTPALDVIEGIDLTGYEVIVTGANSGIGVETLRALAKAGARCILCSRSIEKAQPVRDDIVKSTGNNKIEIEQLELDSLDNVNAFVKRFLAKNRYLNILVNNAGVMACPQQNTKDGFEYQFGTNHLGHFALTIGLLPSLIAGAKAVGRKSRVISLSSIGHTLSDIDFNDINFKNRPYVPFLSYGQAKTCNSLFAVGLNKRYANQGVVSNAVMPGFIMTNLQQHMDESEYEKWGMKDSQGNLLVKMKSIEAGASTSVWAATAPELEGFGGLYLENCHIGQPGTNTPEIIKNMHGYLPHALNEENADKLWKISEEFIKNKSPN